MQNASYIPPERPMQIAESLDAALQKMRRLLFEPFVLAVWVGFGVIIFLETQFNNLRFPVLHLLDPEMEDRGVREDAEAVLHFIYENGPAVFGLILLCLIGYVIVLVVATWLRTRAQLMLVHAVAENDSRVEAAWRATREQHQSLFLVSLALRTAKLLIHVGAISVSAAVLHIFGVDHVISFVGSLLFIAPIAIVWALANISLSLLEILLREFVVPLMWRFNLPCLEAARNFRHIATDNIPALLAFLLVLAAFYVTITVTAVLAGLLTCFLGFLPIVHQTILAPIYVMQRAVSIAMIESLGPEYAMTPAE